MGLQRNTVINISHQAMPQIDEAAAPGAGRHNMLAKLADAFNRFAMGMASGQVKLDISQVSVAPVASSGTVTIAAGSGTVGATINGVSITTAWAVSDTATATALAAAINASANALVQGLVTASAVGGVVTITCTQKSALGNAITLAATGTGATASGARLTGGAGGAAAVTSITL